MKKTILHCKTTVLTISLLVVLLGCTKKLDRYKDPVWLGGSSLETLEDEKNNGKYSIFIQLMDKAKYRSAVEKQLSTLFVPDNAAFEKYFQEKGIEGIGNLTDEQALALFTLHYLPDPRSANLLIYEKAWNRLESATGEYGTLFFRKPSKSFTVPYIVVPKTGTYANKELYISTTIKYVPVFSKQFFHDFNGNGAVDYPFMYPGSEWGGLLSWHSAKILLPDRIDSTDNIEDLTNPTSSGFIYYIDRVVDIMPTVEQYIVAHQDQFGLFYDLLQRYATITKGSVDKQGRSLYTKSYTNISNIAAEDGPSGGLPACLLYVFTVFLPDNNLLQTYLNNTVLQPDGYPAIDSVPDVTIRYILQSQITNRLELKSKFTKAFYNVYGDLSVIDANDVEPGFMCSNGLVYKSKKILEPNVFICTPGKLFFNKNYSTFLTMLTNANMVATLSSDRKVTLFAPDNNQLYAANIRMSVNATGAQEIQQLTDAGQWKPMSAGDLSTYVQDHIYNGELTDLTGNDYLEMFSHNYVHYSNNSITGGLNNQLGTAASIVGENTSKNGKLYYISNPIQTKFRIGQYLVNDPDLSEFVNIMALSQIIQLDYQEKDTKNIYPNISITENSGAFYWTVFAPTNQAIHDGLANGSIDTVLSKLTPAELNAKIEALKNFVYYHLVQKVIFDNGRVQGIQKTYLTNSNITITNNVNNLVITDATGQNVAVDHANANHVVKRGVVHKITSVLKYK
jgi:uncharacterized surface protein with fasciclin (FAS1) repeats